MADSNGTEKWLPVVGYEGYYEVSDHGRIRSLERKALTLGRSSKPYLRKVRQRILSQKIDKLGYCSVHFSRFAKSEMRKVHRLVLEAFIGPCPDKQVCRHFPDRAPTNNYLTNLSWGTRKENENDKNVHGTRHRGEASATSKIMMADVGKIFSLHDGGLRPGKIAIEIGISRSQIRRILSGENWAHYSHSR